MVEVILPGIYKIEVPLPHNPLQSVNVYVIKDKKQNLVIDTGMNRAECRAAVLAGLEEINVGLDKIDFFVTHMHSDHCGLVANLTTETPIIYCSRLAAVDIAGLDGTVHWEELKSIGRLSGFQEVELQKAIDNHPGYKYRPVGRMNFKPVRENDVLNVGGYQLVCIETPGHTSGHVCLYEPNFKILFSGDHILMDITPNISLATDYDRNLLSDFNESLSKVYKLDVSLVLPGHRSLFSDCKGRIKELKYHHKTRATEVLSILENATLDAYHIAAQMTWDMTYESWDLFPVAQKWFACGEALAHLKYLEEMDLVSKEEKAGVYYFSRVTKKA